jgi:multiple sugar transport system permease protein
VAVASTRRGVGRAERSAATGTGAGTVGIGKWTPYLFLAPFLVLFTAFALAPSLYAIWISLHSWDYLLPAKPWVGLENFADLFTAGSATGQFFWQSMKATGYFVLFSVPVLVVVPLLVALILNAKFPGRNFFRAAFFAPYVLGVAVVGLLWRFLLDPAIGAVNYFLDRFHLISEPIAWTNSMPWAWVTLVFVTVWWTLGFNTIIYLAGLQEVDRQLIEAARVDGASRLRTFWHVTLPQLRNVFLFVITITVIASANMFGQSYMITQGAPGVETRTAILYIAQESFQSFRMGSAAAMSIMLAAFLAVLGIANFVLFGRRRD